ncbi:IS110 family RNA-guided transposase [Thermocoleostomius sinensis]|uniref:IS110 family transposase n=1 Tax=Thermocoleostomius sinensis A174 TaxID=2016057 RepID=A0A9E8ZHD9_9CYAN|nr:IS110 family transposase [Thermocoleostomius sinensis]WAL58578.1 IS110 family transposase [Thermocoleostomius sinensis A174]WAL60779.1 IS110 family transposase [Thermocoleostomius sinensis A174]WAL61797.1 IS110 family transposase [Thermocoleostomius sinensis A174]WAL62016.1 IS110 family transposase [Thermocoleostomius sinensis A174]
MNQNVYAAYIGIDWSDRKHDIYLYDCTTGEIEESVIGAQPDAIAAWVKGLRKRYGNALLAVCLEQKRGPLIYALCQYENLVLYPINPRTVSNYRKAFQPSRAKSDPIDARILVELLQKHQDKLPAWQPESAQMRALRQWVESRRMLVGEKVRLSNRRIAALKNYYPQVLDWFEDKDTQVFCAFVERYPTLKDAQAAPPEELTQFFRSHQVIRRSAITRRIAQIAASGISLTEDPGIVEPMQWLVQTLIGQLKPLLLRLTELTLKIDRCFTALPDAGWFAALPGAGEHLAPRLLAAFGEERSRFDSAQQMMCYFGIAPVRESSGKKNWVHWRWSCPIFLRQTFVEWVNQSRHHCAWAQAYYRMQRAKGNSHPAAMRSLAFKWIRILFGCWKNREPYDEAKYVAALQRKGSPIVKLLGAI